MRVLNHTIGAFSIKMMQFVTIQQRRPNKKTAEAGMFWAPAALDLIRFAVDRHATTSLAMTCFLPLRHRKASQKPWRSTAASGYARLAVTGLGLAPRGGLFEVHPIHDVGVGLVANDEFFEQATDRFDVVVVSGDAQGAQLRL